MASSGVPATPPNTPAAATPPSGLVVFDDAAWVVCQLCATSFSDAGKLKHHVYTAAHREAVTKAASSSAEGAADGASSATGTTATALLADAKAALSSELTAAQIARRALYIESPWPRTADAPHLPAVPGLPVLTGWVACYSCRATAPTAAGLHKAPAACAGKGFPVALQSLQRGNKRSYFPVAFARRSVAPAPAAEASPSTVRPESQAAAAAAPPPPSAALLLPLDVFLGTADGTAAAEGGRRRGGAAAALPTSDATNDAESGGILVAYDWKRCLDADGWTPADVARRMCVYDGVDDDVPKDASGWLFFSALRAAVGNLFADALADARAVDPTVLGKLAVGGAAAGEDAASFNVRIGDGTVSKYAHDTSLALYTVVALGRAAGRPDATVVSDGWTVPQLSVATVTAAMDTVDAYLEVGQRLEEARARRDAADRAPAAPVTGVVGTAAHLASDMSFVQPVGALLQALLHERFDPRGPLVGGAGKLRPDVTLIMPYLAVVYPSYGHQTPRGAAAASGASAAAGVRNSSDGADDDEEDAEVDGARVGGVRASAAGEAAAAAAAFMDAAGAQHLASALLFAIRMVNTMYFAHVERETAEEVFADIASATDPSSTTAASAVVQLSAKARAVARTEAVAPAFLPCDEPSHVPAGCPRSLCGTLLGRGLHLSTATVGARVASEQAAVAEEMTALLGGYDPTASGFYDEARLLVDSPSMRAPGVSFLQLPANARRVRGWVEHFLASGALDGPGAPVRVAVKTSAAAAALEADPSAPPVEASPGAVDRFHYRVEGVRARLWAIAQVVCGGPGRQTETASLTLCTSSARSRRCVYVHDGEVYFVVTYSKMTTAHDGVGRPILRFVDAATSTLLLLLLVFLDPLDAYVARAARCGGGGGGGSGAGVDRSLLYRDRRGARLPARRLSAALEVGLLGGVSVLPVTVRAWRQWAAGAAKVLTEVDVYAADFGAPRTGQGAAAATASIGGGAVDWGTVLERQAGHTPTTAAASYAGDASMSFATVNNGSVFLFRRVSFEWHTALGLPSSHGAGPSLWRPDANVARRRLAPTTTTTRASSAAGSTGFRAVAADASHEARRLLTDAASAAATQWQLARPLRPPHSAVCSVIDARVRELYGARMYKSATQREAVHAVATRTEAQTLLVVLPTGGGKTLTFTLPCLVESLAATSRAFASAAGAHQRVGGAAGALPPVAPAGRDGVRDPTASLWCPPVTVVLTMTRAVTSTITEAATALGVTVASWPRGATATDAAMVVMDLCTAVANEPAFRAWLMRLSAAGRLARVVIDEAHLAVLWVTFRPHLLHVRRLLAGLPCVLLLLTATAPPRFMNSLVGAVNVDPSRPFAVIRSPSTRRRNLRYLVEGVPGNVPYVQGSRNRELHDAIAARVMREVAHLQQRAADDGVAGKALVLGVFCETVAEVDGVAQQLHAALDRRGAFDTVVLKFHSQLIAGWMRVRQGGEDGDASDNEDDGPDRGGAADDSSGPSPPRPPPAVQPSISVRRLRASSASSSRSATTGASREQESLSATMSAAAVVAAEVANPTVRVVLVVGSPAVSTGTDFPAMPWALYLGARNMLALAQATGRLGRTSNADDVEETAVAVVLNPVGFSEVLATRRVEEMVPASSVIDGFDEWADLGSTTCRRVGLDAVMDGVPASSAVTCIAGGWARCDVCSSSTARTGGRKRARSDGSVDAPRRTSVSGGTPPRPLAGTPLRRLDGSDGEHVSPTKRRAVGRVVGWPLALSPTPARGGGRTPPPSPQSPFSAVTAAPSGGSPASGGGGSVSRMEHLSAGAAAEMVVSRAGNDAGARRGAAQADDADGFVYNDAALVRVVLVEAAVRVGKRAARAVFDSRRGHMEERPCVWCRAVVRPSATGRHTLRTCFPGVCVSCYRECRLNASKPLPSLSGQTEWCGMRSVECRLLPKAWSAAARDEAEPAGCCAGCFLPDAIVPPDSDVNVALHDIDAYGPAKCPYGFCIRVALVQVHLTRLRMSHERSSFADALFDVCRVRWEAAPAGDGDGDVVGRVPPSSLLDWGSLERPSPVANFAQWLTAPSRGGGPVPNILLFAPVLADAFGLRW